MEYEFHRIEPVTAAASGARTAKISGDVEEDIFMPAAPAANCNGWLQAIAGAAPFQDRFFAVR
ncbi:hypothetical protein CCY01nite_45790 [Chitinophaga cymbidii]|uniref:Uncharacterized protein n=1 Tax=Chitinophaga cymbidii TaxID=1096750 RepID=A0A512RRJ1_9BACT|nr:hypothetical protein CCY01nite_45790 [Chitinophaga cymbidii]